MVSRRKLISLVLNYTLLIMLGVVIIYPFLWLIGSSFKTSSEIFSDPSFIPSDPTIDGYINGWKGAGLTSFGTFFRNTYVYVILKVIFTVVSATITAYGFSRFEFRGRKILQSILIATLLFPATVVLVPTYVIFSKLGWVDSYLPMIVPSIFAADTYFVFLLMSFFRSLPRDMDEAAIIDGCGPLKRLALILVPMIKPAIITALLFQFIWTGNDFLNPMIYISTEAKFPVSVALKMSMDTSSGSISYNNVFAMSVLAILPPLIVFIFAQRNFVEGISTQGLKG